MAKPMGGLKTKHDLRPEYHRPYGEDQSGVVQFGDTVREAVANTVEANRNGYANNAAPFSREDRLR